MPRPARPFDGRPALRRPTGSLVRAGHERRSRSQWPATAPDARELAARPRRRRVAAQAPRLARRARLDGILQGDYRSLFTGHGFDLAEVREYQPEDDIRYMDWNVTARMDHPYVRQYIEDREITAWLLLDLSPSVDFGTANARKRDLVVDFAGVMARLLTRHGNRSARCCSRSGVEEVLQPRGGQLQTLRLHAPADPAPTADRSGGRDRPRRRSSTAPARR